MKIDLSIFMSCKAGFLLTISLFCQQEVKGSCFSTDKQEPDIDQYFLKENVAWQSQVLVDFFLMLSTRSQRFMFFLRKTGYRFGLKH